jgi:hypothetical protein
LNRRQLQDVGLYYFQEAMEEESFEAMFRGIQYYDMALNNIDATAKGGRALSTIIAQVVPDEQEAEVIDKKMGKIQENHQREAQAMKDRIDQQMNQEENDEGEKEDE